MSMDDRLAAEARVLGKYLIGEEINERAATLYLDAHRKVNFDLDEKDRLLLDLILKRRFLAGCVDGGLALLKKRSNLRKKIYYLFAILESMPEYAEHFMGAKKTPFRSAVEIAWFGVRGVFRACVGVVLYFLAGRA